MVIRKAVIIALGAVIALGALPAGALFIDSSYVGTYQGDGVWSHYDTNRRDNDLTLSAWARFSLVDNGNGGQLLEIVLGNNSPQPTDDLGDVLQGVFFTASGVQGPAAPVAFANENRDGAPHVTTWVPDEASWDADTLNTWAYRGDLDEVDSVFHDIYGVTHGIANPGIDDPFGPQATIGALLGGNPNDYWPEHPPYGIVAPGTSDFHNTHKPWIDHSLRFAFHVDDNFTLADIQDNVVFHYGTSANIGVVPEPATYSLLGLGLAGLAVRRAIRRKRQ